MEPNLDDLFRPKRFTRQQVIVMILICVLGAWLLWPSPPPHPRPNPAPAPRPAPKPAAPPLFVTVVPEEAGWCCVEGKIATAARSECKGTFFAREAEAKKACPTAPSGSPRGRGTGI